MDLLVNIDVPDLATAEAFYTTAFGLRVTRRFGAGGAELSGLPARIYLLEKPEGSVGAGADRRRYGRHWTPVHLDIVVEELEPALAQALAAGATLDSEPRTHVWAASRCFPTRSATASACCNSSVAATTRSRRRSDARPRRTHMPIQRLLSFLPH